MKNTVCLIMLVVVSAAWAGPPDKMAAMHNFAADCKKLESANDADVELVKKNVVPTTMEGKCFVECMFEKLTLLENGKFSVVNADKACESMLSQDPDKLKKAKETNQICAKLLETASGTSRCNQGPVLLKCIVDNMPGFQLIH